MTADLIAGDYMGFTINRGDIMKNKEPGYTTNGIWAPMQALKEKNVDLNWVTGHPVPNANVTANEMLDVLKTGRSLTTKTGIKLIPEPDLLEKVTTKLARMTFTQVKGLKPDYVVTPESSSRVAELFGDKLAALLGADHVPAGVIKTRDANKPRFDVPQKMKGKPSEKTALASLERWKKKIRKGETPSLRSHFDARSRHHLSHFMDPSDKLIQRWAEEPTGKTVLLADDVVTTGTTQKDSRRALEELGYVIVGSVAMFKEQS